MGGEVTWTTNFTALTRKADDPFKVVGDPMLYYHGTAGTYVRATAEADWQKRFVGPGGQVFTPFASLRGDFYSMDPNGSTATQLTSDPTATRFMPAVGFEWSWPILARLGYSSHIIEPIAQLIIRPNETGAGELPNNDAQSLVFDDTTLFSRDKFSGFDRIEGGTRLNVGIHYLGTFASGFSVDALFGQSYQLAGDNPYAAADIAYAAATSGLATATSDYVGRVAVTSPEGATFTARGRFDQHDFGLNRGEIIASKTSGSLTAAVSYLYLAKDPNAVNASGEVFDAPASVIRAAGSVAVNDEWKIFGGVAYDFTNASLAANSLGIAYDNSCLSVSVAYSETRDPYTDLSKSQSVKLRLALRTLTKSDTKIDYTDLN
jgi:LPS-assembly protein